MMLHYQENWVWKFAKCTWTWLIADWTGINDNW